VGHRRPPGRIELIVHPRLSLPFASLRFAATSIEPLDGGCFGGTVFDRTDFADTAVGWSGGGAIQLMSRVEVSITGEGAIDASGGGGAAGLRVGGGGGGGGGAVLVEAPQVILDGPLVVISTKGGGGAGGSGTSLGGAGADGGSGPAPATGGTSPIQTPGGSGGGLAPPQDGAPYLVSSAGGGGGGGGAAGITAIFTAMRAIAPQNGAAIRGATTSARVRTRRVP
jgi:hypothetical protein